MNDPLIYYFDKTKNFKFDHDKNINNQLITYQMSPIEEISTPQPLVYEPSSTPEKNMFESNVKMPNLYFLAFPGALLFIIINNKEISMLQKIMAMIFFILYLVLFLSKYMSNSSN